jgi:hypothetical protein
MSHFADDDTLALIESLKQQLAESKKQNVLLRGIVKRTQQACLFVDDDSGVGVASDVYISTELFNDVCKALDATADLSGYILCDAEPFAWRLHNENMPYGITTYVYEQVGAYEIEGWEVVDILYKAKDLK